MKKTLTLLIVALVFSLTVQAGQQRSANAQTTIGDWTEPMNLSRSGGSINPSLVVDSSNILHAVWQDLYAGYIYTRWDGAEWSPPDPVSFPFDEYIPNLVADGPERVHAFWIEEDTQIRYSRVNSDNFGSSGNWTGTQILGRSASNLAAVTDSLDNIHLFYVRPEDSASAPAGVYVRTSTDGGVRWSVSTPVYLSPYMRVLIQEDANLSAWSVDQGGQPVVYAAWDNRPLKRIFFTSSQDGGETWQEPVSMMQPSSTSSSVLPFGVELGATEDQLIAVWNLGFPGGNCDQYYQWSLDNGQTWSEPQQMLAELIISNCPTDNLIIRNDEGELFLLTTFLDQVYLQAWDGTRWSQPRAQNPLFNFNDPETLNSVVFRCHQFSVLPGSELIVIGCDSPTGGISGGDIWSISRNLGSVSDWFPSVSAWKEPAIIQSGFLDSQAPITLSSTDGIIHTLWRQPETILDDGQPSNNSSIFYSRFVDGVWSDAALILRANSKHAGNPSAIIDRNNRFQLVFVDEFTGELYYSWASSDRAINSDEWAEKSLLYSQYPVGNHPAIIEDNAGTLYIFFAVPINEDRGIYYLKSDDGGSSWSSPIQVFDAALADWELVNEPQVATSAEGSLHLLFNRRAIIQTDLPPNLYFSQSFDGGGSWTLPELVVDNLTSSSDILGIGNRVLHRVWLQEDASESIFSHDYSIDNGATWTREPNLLSGDERGSDSQLFVDRNEKVHILTLGADLAGNMRLNHRVWEGDRWTSIDELDLNLEPIETINSLNGTISPDGNITAIFNALIQDFQGEETERFYFSESLFPLSGDPPTPLPPLGNTPEPTVDPIQGLDPTPTSTPLPLVLDTPGTPIVAGSQWIGAIVGALLSGFIVIVVLLIGWRRRASRG